MVVACGVGLHDGQVYCRMLTWEAHGLMCENFGLWGLSVAPDCYLAGSLLHDDYKCCLYRAVFVLYGRVDGLHLCQCSCLRGIYSLHYMHATYIKFCFYRTLFECHGGYDGLYLCQCSCIRGTYKTNAIALLMHFAFKSFSWWPLKEVP